MSTSKFTLTAAAGLLAIAVFSTGCTTVLSSSHLSAGRPLRVSVDVKAENPEVATVARRLREQTAGVMTGCGYAVTPAKEADASVAISLASSVFDKSGNFYVVDFSVPSATLTSRLAGDYIAAGNFEKVRGERTLDLAPAVEAAASKVVPKIIEWAPNAVNGAVRSGRLPLNVNASASVLEDVISCRRRSWWTSEDPVYIDSFARFLAGVDGVKSVQPLGRSGRRTWQFRIVYDAARFPGGFLNAVANAGREFDLSVRD